jgi:myosin heavy subunit
MVEDDDDEESDAFGLESTARSLAVNGNGITSEEDKKKLQEYEQQVQDLQSKVDSLEANLRQKDEELEDRRKRESVQAEEKEQFNELRAQLEAKLEDAQQLNDSLKKEIDRLHADHDYETRELNEQLQQLQLAGGQHARSGASDAELERENAHLRAELEEQQQVTDDVRREAQNLLHEMKLMAASQPPSWDREQELEAQVGRLEKEAEDWRNRYAKARSQLRSVRASSIGLGLQPQLRAGEWLSDDGLVRDVHVSKFQISIDELLRMARSEHPESVTEQMKRVVLAVGQLTRDIDANSVASTPASGEPRSPRSENAKLKSRVSATANNLITASKNYANSSGLSPVSLLDAAASHLTTAVVELVKSVKIRPTPADELGSEDEDVQYERAVPAVVHHTHQPSNGSVGGQPQPFMGLRASNVSSMYSAVSSPRVSAQPHQRQQSRSGWSERRAMSRGQNSISGLKTKPLATVQQGGEVEELKVRPQRHQFDFESF